MERPNHPHDKERPSYIHMLHELRNLRSAKDAMWYGHAKGILSWDRYPGVAAWTEALYEATLDYWPLVQQQLQSACCTGAYRRGRPGVAGSLARWHYSGSFRWMRSADTYSRDWQAVDPGWCGGEAHVGRLFRIEESDVIHADFAGGGLGMYLADTWDRWATAERAAFVQAHQADRLDPVLATVVLTAHRQPERVHNAIASVQAQTIDSWQLLIVDSGSIAASGAYDRYAGDARIQVMLTGETQAQRDGSCIQGWAINEAWRRGRVRGDLVMYLSDDDCLDPRWLSSVMEESRRRPEQLAWHGPAVRSAVHADGREEALGRLQLRGVAGPGNGPDCVIDGMQVVHRRVAWTPWPEDRSVAAHADGVWMTGLCQHTPIHPLPALVGRHRHTPLSTFTRSRS